MEVSRAMKDSRVIELIYTFSDLDIPTAFNPNGDEANETWQISTANGTTPLYEEAEVKVLQHARIAPISNKRI
jgi:hypothetical protein